MKPAGEACLNCPCRDNKIVLPEKAKVGHGRVKLAIVGEAPGREELREGRPFFGASGRLMMKELKRLGPSRADIHWTNAVLCECPPEHQAAAAKACKERLRKELEAVDPIMVLPTGAWGLGSTLGLKKKPQILKWRGSVSRKDFSKKEWDPEAPGNSLVVPTVHPAFILRGGDKWLTTFRRDLERAVRLVFEGWTSPEFAPSHRMVVARTEKQLADEFPKLTSEVSFDVETLSLGPTETPLICFGASDGNLTIVVPWSVDRSGTAPYWQYPKRIADIVSEQFQNRTVWGHNSFGFDHIVAQRYGIDLGNDLQDTLNLYHVLESHLPKNLGHVVSQFLDAPPWKQWNANADLEGLYRYNGVDCVLTILVARELKSRLAEAA